MVEPLPEAYEALLTKKRKAFCIKTCLSTEKKVTEVDFDAAGLVGGIINGQFKPAEDTVQYKLEKRKFDPNFKFQFEFERRTLRLECLPLTSLILAMGNPTVDLLILDIEGAEWPVLQTIDFEKVNINVIALEMNHIGEVFDGHPTEVRYFLKRHGFVLWKTVQIDEIWVKKDFLKDEL